MWNSLIKKKPQHYFNREYVKFDWNKKQVGSSFTREESDIVDKNLGMVPKWLKEDKDFRESLKHRLDVLKIELFKILAKQPY